MSGRVCIISTWSHSLLRLRINEARCSELHFYISFSLLSKFTKTLHRKPINICTWRKIHKYNISVKYISATNGGPRNKFTNLYRDQYVRSDINLHNMHFLFSLFALCTCICFTTWTVDLCAQNTAHPKPHNVSAPQFGEFKSFLLFYCSQHKFRKAILYTQC